MEWILPEWLVALALTLFVVDIFVSTEVLSWGGVLSLSLWLTCRIHTDWKWDLLIFIGALVFFAFAYYWGVRATVGRLVKNLMQKGAPPEMTDRIVGAVGAIHQVGGVSSGGMARNFSLLWMMDGRLFVRAKSLRLIDW